MNNFNKLKTWVKLKGNYNFKFIKNKLRKNFKNFIFPVAMNFISLGLQ
jgi:hypothetical protein